jgi:hypothetical protein
LLPVEDRKWPAREDPLHSSARSRTVRSGCWGAPRVRVVDKDGSATRPLPASTSRHRSPTITLAARSMSRRREACSTDRLRVATVAAIRIVVVADQDLEQGQAFPAAGVDRLHRLAASRPTATSGCLVTPSRTKPPASAVPVRIRRGQDLQLLERRRRMRPPTLDDRAIEDAIPIQEYCFDALPGRFPFHRGGLE